MQINPQYIVCGWFYTQRYVVWACFLFCLTKGLYFNWSYLDEGRIFALEGFLISTENKMWSTGITERWADSEVFSLEFLKTALGVEHHVNCDSATSLPSSIVTISPNLNLCA